MASNQFERALAKKKNAAKLLRQAKKAKANSFSTPTIEDGSYVARIKAESGVTKTKGIPYARLRWSIVEGDYKSISHMQDYFLALDDPEREQIQWDSLSKALQILSSAAVEDWEIEDLGDILDEIAETQPLCRIGIKNWTSSTDATKTGLNVYFNELVDGDEVDESADESDHDGGNDNDDAEVDDDEDDDATEDAPEDTDDDENDATEGNVPPPEKGEMFGFKPPRGKKDVEVEIITVNQTRETCSVKDGKGRKYTGIDWTKLTELVED